MLGGQGLADSSKIALLNANYMAHRLSSHYSLRFKNGKGRVAHELLIDLAEFDKAAGLKVTDFAKRLQVRRSPYVSLDRFDLYCTGLRIPSTNVLLADIHLHVDRTNRI